jgi:alkylhydroperoxidase family enzyme
MEDQTDDNHASAVDDGGPTQPHRLPLLTAAQVTGEAAVVLAKLERADLALDVMRLLANAPHILRPFTHMSRALIAHGTLPPWLREIVILRIAVVLDLPYEWDEHVPMSTAAGVSAEQRDAVRSDAYLKLFDDRTLAALRVTHELLERNILSDASWLDALHYLGAEGTLELVCVVGWWGGFVAHLLNGAGLRHPISNETT